MNAAAVVPTPTLPEVNTGASLAGPEFYPDMVMPNNKPISGYSPVRLPELQQVEAATFGETAGANFRLYNMPYRAIRSLYQSGGRFGPALGREEGYNPIEEGLLDGIDENYWNRILSQGTREDALQVISNIHQEEEDKEIVERSGTMANLVTTLGASLLDPTMLIPISQTVKYASASRGFVANSINTARSLAPIVGAQNAVLVGTKETEGIKDWAIDSLVETLLGSAIGGAMGGFAARGFRKEQALGEASIRMADKDIVAKVQIPKEGGAPKLVARAMEGSSVGAKEVEEIQTLLNIGQASWADNKWMRGIFAWSNPMVDGLTNRFKINRRSTNGFFPNFYEVAGREAELINDPSAWDFVQSWNAKTAHADHFIDQAYYEFIGIEGPMKGLQSTAGEALDKLAKRSENYVTKEEFRQMTGPAFRRGESKIPQLDAIVKRYKEEIYDPLFKELQTIMPGLTETEFTNISQYLNRQYDVDKMLLSPGGIKQAAGFKNDIVSYLSGLNEQRYELVGGLESVSENISRNRETLKGLKGEEAKALKAQNQALKREMQQLERELEEAILDKKVARDLLEGELNISREGLEASERATKKLKEAEASGDKAAIKKAEKELLEDVEAGKINKDAYHWPENSTKPKFITREDIPKVRRSRSVDEMWDEAEGVFNSITQMSDEQVSGAIFDSIQGGGNNITKSRTVLWNDALAEKWLHNDLGKLSRSYSNQVSKRVYYDRAVRNITGPGGGAPAKELLVAELTAERAAMQESIMKEFSGKQQAKELKKLNKDFKKAVKFQENLHNLYFGGLTDRNALLNRASESLKKFSVMTMLGNVPILQLTEYASPLFRFTFEEYIQDGIGATVAHMHHKMTRAKGPMKQAYREAFADLGVACNYMEGGRMKATMGMAADASNRNVVENTIDNLAKLSQQVSGANFNMDLQETIVSFASQSRIIRTLEKYKTGEKLLKHEVDMLDRARLNPKDWADRITSQFGIHKTEEGAFVANFHRWEDAEAARRFGIAIEREVRQVIVKPTPLDTPFLMRDPLVSTMMQFTSFMFTATNNFLIPAVSRLDLQKVQGITAMIALSSMVGPLREMSRGEEPNMDMENLLREGVLNSGVMGIQLDALARVNAYIDAPPLRFLQPDRYKRKATGAFQMGPSSSLIEMGASIISAVANDEWNQSDAKKATRLLVPFSGTWFLRKSINDILEGTDLPKTRGKAKKRKGE
jgi:hypothetical protein